MIPKPKVHSSKYVIVEHVLRANVEAVLEEKFKKLQSQKTEWVNMGCATHQVRIGLEDVIDTDTLVLRFLPVDDPATRLLDLGILLLFIVNGN